MKSHNNENQNFWISYADLMAGLLFVFILLIGAIVIKYVFLQDNLHTQKDILSKEKKESTRLKNQLISSQDALKAIKMLLSDEQAKSSKSKQIIAIYEKSLRQKDESIRDNLEEIANIKEALKKEQNQRTELSIKLDENVKDLNFTKGELEKISQQLLQSTLAHQKLVQDLNITKARIKNLTGIRIQAIKILKNKLGKNIQIDQKSGAIRLSSSVLFDKGSASLKKDAKKTLSKTLTKYINTLLKDEKLKDYIENIVIEGHTDTDGGYMYNLKLSQQRAFNVLDYLYKQKQIDAKLLQKHVSASGKSYSEIILKNGKEDQEKSRRIEVKFTISNKKAVQEIEEFLKGEYN